MIELEKVEDINWLNINPYNPPLSKGKVTVYSIRTSEDGFSICRFTKVEAMS